MARCRAEWERIPAETSFGRKRVLHVLAQERVDQTRGKPLLTPVIEQFRMLDSYQRTELQSSIVNSLVAGIIETPLDPAAMRELMGGDPNKYLAGQKRLPDPARGRHVHPALPRRQNDAVHAMRAPRRSSPTSSKPSPARSASPAACRTSW